MSNSNHVNPIGDGVSGVNENLNANPMVKRTVPPTVAPDAGEVASGPVHAGSTGRSSSNAMPELLNVAQALTVMMATMTEMAGFLW